MATSLIENVTLKYGGTDEETYYKVLAKNLAAVSYAGTHLDFWISSLQYSYVVTQLVPTR